MLKRRLSLIALALLLAFVAGFGCAARPPVLPDANAKLREYANAELAQARLLVQARDPEQIFAALQHLARAEAVLELPRDARLAAEVHVWTGMAHMQAGRTDRGRQHFRIAHDLFESIGAEAEAEGVEQLLRR